MEKRALYNLPRGEGFLTDVIENKFGKRDTRLVDKFMVKIGLDGKVKQFLNPGLECPNRSQERGSLKFFEDNLGNYCVSTTCTRTHESPIYYSGSNYVKFYSKCFKPGDLTNLSDIKPYESYYDFGYAY
uniref:Uncharacterized protein n=1 Tax=Trichogramma kaykai TaxID=54128 RepID=A0ABD2X4Q5_9HYME